MSPELLVLACFNVMTTALTSRDTYALSIYCGFTVATRSAIDDQLKSAETHRLSQVSEKRLDARLGPPARASLAHFRALHLRSGIQISGSERPDENEATSDVRWLNTMRITLHFYPSALFCHRWSSANASLE